MTPCRLRLLAAGFLLGCAQVAHADIQSEQTLLDQVQALHGAGAVLENPRRCGTPLIVEARHTVRDPALRAKLAQSLARPQLPYSYRTPSGYFRVHYDLMGRDAVDPADTDGDRVPDYVEEAATALDEAWKLEVEVLGYRAPPGDGGVDGEEYDVFLTEQAGGAYGWTYPDSYGTTTSSYIELDNNYAETRYWTQGLDGLRVTAAHEFFHAVQFGYYQGADGIWWQEASATWMEEVAHSEADDYLNYLSAFLSDPERALDSPSFGYSDVHIYGAALFAHFLDQRHERSLIRATWEEWGRQGNAGLEHFDRVLRRQTAQGLGEAVSEFSVWNYFTGPRYRPGHFYAESEKYPAVRSRSLATPAKVTVQHSDFLDHLASTYVRLEPQGRSGGLRLRFAPERGQWRAQLLLVGPESLHLQSLGADPVEVPGWDQYAEVVLVLTTTDQEGLGYGYGLDLEYDPELIDQPAPLALRLAAVAPNPFRPARQAQTVFAFELDQASAATWLSIFAADGLLVRRYDLGQRAARAYTQAWDGRNEAGELVGSGIYYGVLQTPQGSARRTLALLRD
ncbi:MAG: hypothetical protein IT369_19955 [Candidatus Latescibacteria bacterium]|nr:hypothetical protein [Candidatus Latescibacterota bacterium]